MSSKSIIVIGDQSNKTIENTNSIANNDALLFKVREIFFKKGLPIYKQQVAKILKQTWLSKLNKTAFESQNGLRILVKIHEISNFMTNKDEEVFGFQYTVSINGQDPKFLGVQEPTFEDYLFETKSQNLTFLEFCPCNTFKIDRFYVNNENNLALKLNDILSDAWKESNSRTKTNHTKSLAKNRIIGRSKLDHSFYDSSFNSISRLALTWLVDGADPNEIYFNRPKLDKILSYVQKFNFKIFTEIPYVKQSIDITSLNTTLHDLLKKSIQLAWHSANPHMKENSFDIILENNDDEFLLQNQSRQTIVKRNAGPLQAYTDKTSSSNEDNKLVVFHFPS